MLLVALASPYTRFMRWRRTLKWTCTAAALFIAIVYVASLHLGLTVFHLFGTSAGPAMRSIDVGRGSFQAMLHTQYKMGPGDSYGWSVWLNSTNSPVHWMPIYSHSAGLSTLRLPLWLPLLLVAVPAGLLWHTDLRAARRARRFPNHCPACAYDLSGSPGPCPECGAAPPSEKPS